MGRRRVSLSLALTFLLLSAMLSVVLNLPLVRAIYIRADGSVEGTTDIVSSDNVTYVFTADISDSIVVERSNIIIDGVGYALQGAGSDGVFSLSNVSNVTIKNTNITATNWEGIWLYGSSNNSMTANNITANSGTGIWLYGSSNNSMTANNITANSGTGIWLSGSSNNNSISGNNIANNGYGIGLDGSSNYNSITANSITANRWFGIELSGSSNNSIYHNNFINNPKQVDVPYSGYANVWDDGYPSGGNYWSDYSGVDADGDGIGDTAYVIDANNRDRYPLVFPLAWDYSNPIPVVWAGAIYPVALSSNSTISGFRFNHLQKQISFNLTGSSGATGYCNVTIPKALLVDSQWTITINGVPKTDYTKTENVTHTFLYFTYTHASTSHVIIQGTSVIPEFPQFIILPLFMVLTLLAVVLARKSLLKKTKNLNSQTPFF